MEDESLNYLEAIDKLEELRILMKKLHRENDKPYRRAEFQAMMYLMTKEKITMQELGEELCVTKPRVTALVNDLLEKDFVVITNAEKDKRKKYLQLSTKGLEYMQGHKENYEAWFEKLWNKFDEKEKKAFSITLNAANRVIKEELIRKEEE